MAEAPAGKEGKPPGVHLHPPQQGLEARQGGEHMHRIHLLEQLIHAALGEQGIAPMLQIRLRRTLPPQAGHHIGMGLVDDPGLGFGRPHRLQQGQVGVQLGGAVADGGIALHLAGHQHHATGAGGTAPGGGLEVVLGEGGRHQLPPQGRTPGPLCVVEAMGSQQGFEVGGGAGVVVDAAAVDHPGDRGDQIGAEPHRAQEAILDAQQIRLGPLQKAAGHAAPGVAAPDRHS